MCTLGSQPGIVMSVFVIYGFPKKFMPQVPIGQHLRFDGQTSSRLQDVFVAYSSHWQAEGRHQYFYQLDRLCKIDLDSRT